MYVTDQLQAQITGLLIKNFGITLLKDWQLKIIVATLEGRNTLIIQPTGSGKSLCFQLMPFITGKVTVVLTPTISLMKDQCCALEKNKISATYVGSSQTDKEIDAKILSGNFRLVYTTPEKFFDDTGTPSYPFRDLITQAQVGLIAVDEVHLIDSWKSFRYAFNVLMLIFTPILLDQHLGMFLSSANWQPVLLWLSLQQQLHQSNKK